MIRVLVVDDEQLIRAGLVALIGTAGEIEVVGEAGDGVEATKLVDGARPDVIVMDTEMPRMDGPAATRAILQRHRWARPPIVLMLAEGEEPDAVTEAFRAGALGFLPKSTPAVHLVDAIRLLAAGLTVLPHAAARRVLGNGSRAHHGPSADARARIELLTAREREVLLLLARGRSGSEIATALSVSPLTVKSHVLNLSHKLRVGSRTQAVALAYESGFVDEHGTELGPLT